MEMIKGQGSHDSASACLAMVLNATLEDINSFLGYDPNAAGGVLECEVFSLLSLWNVQFEYTASVEYLSHWAKIPRERLHERKLLTPEHTLRARMAQNRRDRFIVAVPSLQTHLKGAVHMVAVEKDYVFDPSPDDCPQYKGSSYSLPLLSVFCVKAPL